MIFRVNHQQVPLPGLTPCSRRCTSSAFAAAAFSVAPSWMPSMCLWPLVSSLLKRGQSARCCVESLRDRTCNVLAEFESRPFAECRDFGASRRRPFVTLIELARELGEA